MADDTAQKVLQALVERKLLAPDKLAVVQQALREGGDVTATLLEAGGVDEEALTQVRAQVLGIPYVDLREKIIARPVLDIVPESTARGHMIVAYEQTDQLLNVAMVDPSDRQIVEFIHKKVELPVEVALASAASLRHALTFYQESLEVDLADLVQAELKNVTGREESLTDAAGELPIVRIAQAVFKHAIVEGASDIHIEPTEREVVIRYRVDGLLRDVLVLPRVVLPGLVARIKVLANLKIDEHRLPQDGRFKIEAEDYKVAFRVSTLPVYDGEKVVMRLLDESGRGLVLGEIGIRPSMLEVLRRAISKPNGMVLVTGPTGSGKTTTLYADMREISTPDINISTIEDPIEYRMPRINQTQVQPKIGLTFANGLRSLVRQDPDVIMVGEIRDEETAALAVNAALTGHLVLSTLHTNSAAGALPRLRDMKVEAFLLASTLVLVMAQRLVRRLCEKCREERQLDEALLKELAAQFDLDRILSILQREGAVQPKVTWRDIMTYKAVGCRQCRGGYKGRTGIYEVFEVTPEMQRIILPETTSTQLEEEARKSQNFITMVEDGFLRVVEGVTTLEEVLRVAQE